MKRTRMQPSARKEDILLAAILLAENHGFSEITRDQIAAKAGITGSAVQYHFETMAQLRRELMRFAVKIRNPLVVAQGLAVRNPYALKADEGLRHEARRALR